MITLLSQYIKYFVILCFLLIAKSSLAQVDQVQLNIDQIIKKFNNSNRRLRWDAVSEIIEIGYPAGKSLLSALNSEDNNICSSAAIALGDINYKPALNPLIQNLKSRPPFVRWSIAYALGELHDDKAINPLCDCLNDENISVRVQAARALVNLGPKVIPDVLHKFAELQNSYRGEVAVIYTLSHLGTDSVDQLFIALNTKDNECHRISPLALGQCDDPRVVDHLIKGLGDDDPIVRKE